MNNLMTPNLSIKNLLVSVLLISPIIGFGTPGKDTSELMCKGHLPDNLEPGPIPLEGYKNEGITKKEFDDMVELGIKHYKDIVSSHGKTLYIKGNWESEIANASAGKFGNKWEVEMHGGYGRLKGMTQDALTNVLCHEIGHLVGGFPYINTIKGDLDDYATEGQSDYFVGNCFKKLFKDDLEKNATFRDKVQDYPKQTCDAVYSLQEDRDLCYRTAVSGYILWNSVGKKGEAKWGYDNRDKSVVSKTNIKHPQVQCRLDTALSGGLCLEKWDDLLIPMQDNHNKYNCSRGKYVDDYRVGLRPKCWYKPDQTGGTHDPRKFSNL